MSTHRCSYTPLLYRDIKGPEIPLNEHWFQIAGKQIKFTGKEFALITGLIQESQFQPSKKDHIILESSMVYTNFKHTQPSSIKNRKTLKII